MLHEHIIAPFICFFNILCKKKRECEPIRSFASPFAPVVGQYVIRKLCYLAPDFLPAVLYAPLLSQAVYDFALPLFRYGFDPFMSPFTTSYSMAFTECTLLHNNINVPSLGYSNFTASFAVYLYLRPRFPWPARLGINLIAPLAIT